MNNLIKLSSRKYIFLISSVLFLVIFLNYANSLYSSFHYDDEIVVMHDRHIKDLNNYLQLKQVQHRHTLHLTYALNYHWGKLNPFGYHLVNILLHYFTSITIFIIAFITVEKGTLWKRGAALKVAFITALLFALNPIHTETVTYISGRSSGLASFLYFLSLLLFIIGSLKKNVTRVPGLLLYLFSFIAGLMALTSKEICITLPATVLLYDICFMRRENWIKFRTRLLCYYIPLPLLAVFITINYLKAIPFFINIFLDKVDILNTLVQFKIITYVLKLYLLPVNLAFEYQFPALFYSKELSFLPAVVIFMLILICAIIKYHKKFPVLSFAVFWYLITISPTNSILPRTELFNDRNLYLPSFGLCLLFAVSICSLLNYHRKYYSRYLLAIASLMIILILNSALLIKRNNVYKTEISLWEDTLKKSPRKIRVLNNLSRAYVLNGNHELAAKTLISVLATNPRDYFARVNLGKLFADTGRLEMAKNEFKKAIKINPNLAEAYMNLGVYYASKGDFINAQKEFSNSKKHNYTPHPDYYLNKASIDIALNRLNDAENAVNDFLKLFPDTPKAHFLLGLTYAKQGKKTLAIEEYKKTRGNKYFEANAHNNTGIILIEQGKFDEAIVELNKAVSINPDLLEAQLNLGKIFMEVKKDNEKARIYIEKALKLKPELENDAIVKKILLQVND